MQKLSAWIVLVSGLVVLVTATVQAAVLWGGMAAPWNLKVNDLVGFVALGVNALLLLLSMVASRWSEAHGPRQTPLIVGGIAASFAAMLIIGLFWRGG